MILGPYFDIEFVDLDLPEIQGTSEEVAKEKIKDAFRKISAVRSFELDAIVMTEDTSLRFGGSMSNGGTGPGFPGPYIKQFLETLGLCGLVRLANETKSETPQSARAPYAVASSIVCATGRPIYKIISTVNRGHSCLPFIETRVEAGVILFTSTVDGSIVAPRGANGAGWDSIFVPLEQDDPHPSDLKTFAEMKDAERMAVSHRCGALRGFLASVSSTHPHLLRIPYAP